MEKIILTDAEIDVIEKQLDGRLTLETATEDEQTAMMSVIDKAEAALDDRQPTDEELGGDLVKWFYGQYKAQGNEV